MGEKTVEKHAENKEAENRNVTNKVTVAGKTAKLQDGGCHLCPRECWADRQGGQKGICMVAGEDILASRAAIHLWEEPCISGTEELRMDAAAHVAGSGTVFFCGCPLHCVYCQNHEIADAKKGKPITVERLSEIFLELQAKGAANINLVTPTHYTPQIIRAVKIAREQGMHLPVVYNCSGYEKVATLKQLEGIVDIYLTDFKYMDSVMAKRYSHAADYPEVVKRALTEMVRQQPEPEFDSRGMMRKGVIVRHLLLPDALENAKAVVRYVYEKYKDQVFLSLMNQYTPLKYVEAFPEINRAVTEEEYECLVDYAIELGVENGFVQEGETAEESFIPAFDYEGL